MPLLKTKSLFIFVIVVSINWVQSSKLKTYYLNKHNQTLISDLKASDCIENHRMNVSIPKEITLCFRHKIMNYITTSWAHLFVGSYEEDTREPKGRVKNMEFFIEEGQGLIPSFLSKLFFITLGPKKPEIACLGEGLLLYRSLKRPSGICLRTHIFYSEKMNNYILLTLS